MGSRKKRERTFQQSKLLSEIKELEQQHKARQSQAVFHTLTLKREELNSLFHIEQKQQARIVAQCFYEWGNKPSRLLARSLQQKKSASFMSAHLVHDTRAIAKEFRVFYQHLYHAQHSITDRDTKGKLIRDYLERANLPRLSSDTLATLDGELTTSELRIALKAMAKWQSTWP